MATFETQKSRKYLKLMGLHIFLKRKCVKTLRDHLARHLEAVAGQMPRPNPDYRPESKDKGIHTPYDTREGDPSQEKRPVSTNPENGATLPTPE
jgi:hypothetical protein